ncbi:MAG: TetR/AcrR family transcriptional regulator [Dehalococcoidia bacterium]
MTYRNTPARGGHGRRPGRPRDHEREAQILRVVLELLAEVGADGVTFEGVARRAQASKRTLYRRWPTKQEMVVAAIKAGPAASSTSIPIDTGSLRGDLLALLERLEATMEAGRSVSLTLMQAGLKDPELCEHIERSVGPTGARLPTSVIEAAVARGELPEAADPFAYEETAAAVLLIRKLNGLVSDRGYREALVDSVLIPALKSGTAAGQGGIFSGRPEPVSRDLADPKEKP